MKVFRFGLFLLSQCMLKTLNLFDRQLISDIVLSTLATAGFCFAVSVSEAKKNRIKQSQLTAFASNKH